MYHVTRDQGTLVAPRLWAEDGVGRAKLNNDEIATALRSDSGVLPQPWLVTEQGVRHDRKKTIMERTAPNPDEDSQDTTNNPKTKTQTL